MFGNYQYCFNYYCYYCIYDINCHYYYYNIFIPSSSYIQSLHGPGPLLSHSLSSANSSRGQLSLSSATWLAVSWEMSNIFHLQSYRKCNGQGATQIYHSTGKVKGLDRHPVVPYIAKLLRVIEITVFGRMAELEISVSGSYSTISDQELNTLVSDIKMPHIGQVSNGKTVVIRPHGTVEQSEGSDAQSRGRWDSVSSDTVSLRYEEKLLCEGTSFSCSYGY